MLPPLRTIEGGLRRTTEAIAGDLARTGRGEATPEWNDLEWRLAQAAAAVHGVSPLLCRHSPWNHPAWRQFLEHQREHVEHRHRRIEALLERIDAAARAVDLPLIPLKGAALHALGIYAPGERPMADIDLLVRESDAAAAIELLRGIGYVQSFEHWRHLSFKPAGEGAPLAVLGEHRDTPVNIELHTRIRERLPVATIDITSRILPRDPRPGLNPYPSHGALLSHLLLHAAGNHCARNLRLIHLHDIALLARRIDPDDWDTDVLWNASPPGACWWALPPLRMVARYYPNAIPDAVPARLASLCPPVLGTVSRRQTLTQVSCSALWLQTLPGLEWCRTPGEIVRCLRNRIAPPPETIKERIDLVRAHFWLQGQSWSTSSRTRRLLTRLTRRLPRIDMMYVVHMALQPATCMPGDLRAAGHDVPQSLPCPEDAGNGRDPGMALM